MSIPIAPSRDPRGRRHTMATVRLAQRMVAGGWTPTEVARYLTQRDTPVDPDTVNRWCDPKAAERRRQARRRQNAKLTAQKPVGKPLGSTPEYRQRRMEALREVGLSMAAIAKVMKLDFDVELSAWDVNRALPPRLRFPSRQGVA